MFVLIPLGVGFLAGIIYLAVSRRSSRTIKLVALGALAVMVLAVIICLFFVFGVIKTGAAREYIPPDVDISQMPQAAGPNVVALIMFIIFLIVLFILVLVLSMREQQRAAAKDDW